MDDESGDDEKDGLTSEWEDELRRDRWGWQRESGSWSQRREHMEKQTNKAYKIKTNHLASRDIHLGSILLNPHLSLYV